MTLDFDDINVSTSTIICKSNLEVNLDWLFSMVPILEVRPPKVIKISKELNVYICSVDPPLGTITMVEYIGKLRGYKIRKSKAFFRNTLSIAMFVGKLVTIKIPKKGKIQMTGPTSNLQAELCLKYLWELLCTHPSGRDTYSLSDDSGTFKATSHTVMTNIDFKLGFKVNRQNLDIYMNKNTTFNSLLETSFGYTGVNIKRFFEMESSKTPVKTIECDAVGAWKYGHITYEEYLNELSPKDASKERAKKHRNTFLVFQSGAAIMSGMNVLYMKSVYNEFTEIVSTKRDIIEEKILI